jgi:hypothetical protein
MDVTCCFCSHTHSTAVIFVGSRWVVTEGMYIHGMLLHEFMHTGFRCRRQRSRCCRFASRNFHPIMRTNFVNCFHVPRVVLDQCPPISWSRGVLLDGSVGTFGSRKAEHAHGADLVPCSWRARYRVRGLTCRQPCCKNQKKEFFNVQVIKQCTPR